jgi:hypothetical protein
MSVAVALERTVDLVRRDLFPSAADEDVVAALTGTRVRLCAGEQELMSPAGQVALTTAAIVAAECGIELVLDLAQAPLLGVQPPLAGGNIAEALVGLTGKLITRARLEDGAEADLTIALGSTRCREVGALRLAASSTGVTLAPAGEITLSPWPEEQVFAALLGGVAAGTEAFRAAMRRLASGGHSPASARAVREPLPITLAVAEPALVRDLGALDVISAGAIAQWMLFALLRVPGLYGRLRFFDADTLGESNLNRYPLAHRDVLERAKVRVLEELSGNLEISGVQMRFNERLAELAELAPTVAVGVDHVPSRWIAQAAAPGRVLVGATSHFEVVISDHPPGEPCAGCLYRDGEDDGREIPTVSFISAFGGILLAQRLLADTGARGALHLRAWPLSLAGPRPLVERPVARRAGCPAGCARATA